MPDPLDTIALLRRFPGLRARLPWLPLGEWPTAVEPLAELARACGGGAELWVKREDRASPRYGGNKVRTLEVMFGQARAADARRIWSTGGYGSNHALAAALHAPAAGLASGALLWPQPPTDTAAHNLESLMSTGAAVRALWSPASLPFAIWRASRGRIDGERAHVMVPGGATPYGTLAHVSAAIELAEQIEAGACPAPARIVLAVGSTCTTAGLLVGLRVAARLGLAFGPGRAPVPPITAVRVTPWPITSRTAIARLAGATAALLASHVGDVAALDRRDLAAGVEVEPRYLAGGYGRPLAAGRDARTRFLDAGGPALDQVYSEKSGACLLALARADHRGPLLYWATRSSAPLPRATDEQLATAPRRMQRWLRLPRRS
jgi:D-cysteine desulfhydrase